MSKSPLELLFGPMFKGPGFVDVRSHAHQFAGRSTINSGSATVVVSTAAVKSDSLIHFAMEGNANRNIIAGVANINSNAASVTVSNAAIAADSLIFLTTRQNGTAQSSGTVTSKSYHWLQVGPRLASLMARRFPTSSCQSCTMSFQQKVCLGSLK